MPLLSRRKVLTAKVEATSGTLETLTAAEGVFNVFDFDMQPAISMTDRPSQATFTNLPATPESYGATVSFKLHTYGTGTGGIPAWASVFLPGCGWTAALQVFSPKSETPGSNVKTLSIGMYIDGLYKKLRGCAGSFKIIGEAGKAGVIDFTFSGVWQPVTSTALVTPTYPTALPMRVANSTMTWGAWSPIFSKFEVDAGNEVYLRPSQASTGSDGSGLAAACIVNRKVVGTFDPESVVTGTYDYYGKPKKQCHLRFQMRPTRLQLRCRRRKSQTCNRQTGAGCALRTLRFKQTKTLRPEMMS
jgi:hypothetical protein